MDIQTLGMLINTVIQKKIDTTKNTENTQLFSEIFSDVSRKEISVNDMFSAAFIGNDVDVKAGNCNVSSANWERKDFPFWKYFQDDESADCLNNWKITGSEPTGAEDYIQKELRAIGFGKIEIIMPESLQKKMEADPEYVQEIVEKLQAWKTDYDRMDNALAASYGEDPALYQMTKSYCIQLDEDGNIENYTVVSGGIDTRRLSETSEAEGKKKLQKTVVKVTENTLFQSGIGNITIGSEEIDYAKVAPFLATCYWKGSKSD